MNPIGSGGTVRDTEYSKRKKEFPVTPRSLASITESTVGPLTELRKNRLVVANGELHFGHFMVEVPVRYPSDDVREVVK